MRVTIDKAVYSDLDGIHAWIARDRPAAAAWVIDRIFAAIVHLGRFPRTGHPGREPGTFEWVVHPGGTRIAGGEGLFRLAHRARRL